MALSAQQQQIARLLYSLAAPRVGAQRAREFVNAAFHESGLNPHADNPSTHAHGLFQLLSGGYRRRAQQLGGLDNPKANALAILPQYVNYWRSHPHAAAGQAASTVEASGEPASWYAAGLNQIPTFGGGVSTAVTPPARPAPLGGSNGLGAAPVDDRAARLAQLVEMVNPESKYGGGLHPLAQLLQAREQQTPAAMTAPRKTPLAGSVGAGAAAVGGQARHGLVNELLLEGTGGPTHSTGPHVHAAMKTLQAQLAVEQHAREMGLHVGEEQDADTHDAVHAPHSFHRRDFPHSHYREAADISGNAAAMRALYQWVKQHYG